MPWSVVQLDSDERREPGQGAHTTDSHFENRTVVYPENITWRNDLFLCNHKLQVSTRDKETAGCVKYPECRAHIDVLDWKILVGDRNPRESRDPNHTHWTANTYDLVDAYYDVLSLFDQAGARVIFTYGRILPTPQNDQERWPDSQNELEAILELSRNDPAKRHATIKLRDNRLSELERLLPKESHEAYLKHTRLTPTKTTTSSASSMSLWNHGFFLLKTSSLVHS